MHPKQISRYWLTAGLALVFILSACSGGTGVLEQATSTATEPPVARLTDTPTDTVAAVGAEPEPATPTETAPQATATEVQPTTPAPPVMPAGEKLYDGISHGVTEDGFPYLGSADAPVTVIDYSDFL